MTESTAVWKKVRKKDFFWKNQVFLETYRQKYFLPFYGKWKRFVE
jgi:hypothetical protein